MAITKRKVLDLIQIDERAVIDYRETVQVIDDDGSVIGERHQRGSVAPGQGKAGHPRDVRNIVDVLHTPERIAEYLAFVESKKILPQ